MTRVRSLWQYGQRMVAFHPVFHQPPMQNRLTEQLDFSLHTQQNEHMFDATYWTVYLANPTFMGQG